MKVFAISAAIIISCLGNSEGFTSHLQVSAQQRTRQTSAMFHHDEVDAAKIKKAGAGVATKPPGDFSSFDPNESGKLQGTNNCNERINTGAAYGGESAPIVSGSTTTPSAAPTSNLTNLIGNLKSRSQY